MNKSGQLNIPGVNASAGAMRIENWRPKADERRKACAGQGW